MAKSKPMLPISPESSLVNAEARQQKLDTRRGAKKLGKKAADDKRRTTPLLVPPRDAGSDDLPAPGIDLPDIHPVRIENIRPYQNNPRVEINPERDNIKAHIESELALGHPPAPLTVSRRPDSERQLVEVDAGGITRLTLYRRYGRKQNTRWSKNCSWSTGQALEYRDLLSRHQGLAVWDGAELCVDKEHRPPRLDVVAERHGWGSADSPGCGQRKYRAGSPA